MKVASTVARKYTIDAAPVGLPHVGLAEEAGPESGEHDEAVAFADRGEGADRVEGAVAPERRVAVRQKVHHEPLGGNEERHWSWKSQKVLSKMLLSKMLLSFVVYRN